MCLFCNRRLGYIKVLVLRLALLQAARHLSIRGNPGFVNDIVPRCFSGLPQFFQIILIAQRIHRLPKTGMAECG
jgi:hypothetical protein